MSEPQRVDLGLAQLDVAVHEGFRIVTVSGELELSNAAAFERALDALPRPLVVLLDQLMYFDSSAIHALCAAFTRARLSVAATPGSIARRVLDVTAAIPPAAIHDDVATASRHLPS